MNKTKVGAHKDPKQSSSVSGNNLGGPGASYPPKKLSRCLPSDLVQPVSSCATALSMTTRPGMMWRPRPDPDQVTQKGLSIHHHLHRELHRLEDDICGKLQRDPTQQEIPGAASVFIPFSVSPGQATDYPTEGQEGYHESFIEREEEMEDRLDESLVNCRTIPPSSCVLETEAVATMVTENESGDDLSHRPELPTAEPYDESHHATVHPKRRPSGREGGARLASLIIILFAVFAAAAVSVIIPVTRRSQENQHTKSKLASAAAVPLKTRDPWMGQFIRTHLGHDLFEDPQSPYSQALAWFDSVDPYDIPDPATDRILQRYLVAYLYFATSMEKPWRSCSPEDSKKDGTNSCLWQHLSNAIPHPLMQDRQIPLAPPNLVPRPSIQWLSGFSECLWAGVQCNAQSQITSLDLAGANLTGHFPEGLQYLSSLEYLDLSYGSLMGPLPSALFQQLSKLVHLDVSLNTLSGTLPTNFSALVNLQFLNLGYNKFTSTLPLIFPPNLTELYLHHNHWTGELPVGLCEPPTLHTLRVDHNRLQGTLPSCVGQMTRLVCLDLSSNRLSGSIVSEVGRMEALEGLWAGGNLLSGPLPEAMFSWSQLSWLDLSGNHLTGTLSPALGQWKKHLTWLSLDNNYFSGPIPTTLGQLTQLETLKLWHNHLIGSVPAALCQVQRPLTITADCLVLASGIGETAPVSCGCCGCF